MSNITTTQQIDPKIVEALLTRGDVSGMNPVQKSGLIHELCNGMGLNPLTRPFDFMKTKDGKEIPYANKGCAEQLRHIHKISLRIVSREKIEDVYIVTAEAEGKDGRVDAATGVVSLKGLFGENLANALMKAETKAKRRVTLSICGLNMLDETEVDSIPGASKEKDAPPQKEAPEKDVTPKKKSPAKEALEEMEAAEASPGEYEIKSGSQKGKKLKQFSQAELINMSNSIKEHWFNLNKEVPPASQELLNAINACLNEQELS